MNTPPEGLLSAWPTLYSVNIAMGLLLVFVYSAIRSNFRVDRRAYDAFLIGILFAAGAIISMTHPVRTADGLSIDARNVFILVGGLFGGPIGASIVTLVAALYRIEIGGPGTLPGIVTIVISGLIGALFNRHYGDRVRDLALVKIFLIGLLTTLTTAAAIRLIAALRGTGAIPLGSELSGLVIFPLGTVMLAAALSMSHYRVWWRAQQRLADIVETTSDLVWETDADARFTMVSGRYHEVFGRPLDEILGRRPDELGFDWADEATARVHAEARAGRKPFANMAVRGLLRDGSIRVISNSGRPVFDAWGRFAGYRGTAADITERRRMEEDLGRAKEHLTRAQRVGRTASGEIDLRTGRLYWSEELFRLVGLESESSAPDIERFFEAVHPEDRATVRQLTMLNRNGVDTEDCEFRIARPDGVPQWIRRSSEVTRGPDGAANSVFTTFVDITERRATEQAMRDSEQRFAAIFRDSPAGIAITDLSGRRQFVEANLAWLNVLGFERDEVIGRTGLELNLWPDATSREAIYSAVVGPAGFWNGETQLRRIDGGVVDIALTMRRIEVGGQSFAVAISYEITDRKQAENALREAHDDLERRVADRTRELEQANLRLTESSEQLDAARNRAEAEKERAERANDAKSDFLARVSHELRTPLNAVLGFAQLLAINTQEPLTPKQLRQVEQIRKSGDYLLSLIDEILDLSKIEAGTIRVSIERVTLDSVFDHVRDMLQPLADSAGLVLAVELNPDTPPIRADRVRLVQILMNLGTNAIKYNRRGGAVRLTARPADDQMVRIEVVDTGVGIPVDRQGEVFQPFNRLGAEASRVEGTGIGLSISRRLAELMQGRLSFESRPGEGSTFVVELPIAPKTNGSAETAETQSAKNPAWAAKGTSRQFTLLYVEDNPPNIALMQELVDAVPNLRLLTAADASTGLALAHAHRPDIIVLDINLPGMNGFEILRQLKQDHRTREMPVLALSANAQPNDIDRGKAAGFAYYLTKPIDVSKFLGAIEALLKIHHGAK